MVCASATAAPAAAAKKASEKKSIKKNRSADHVSKPSEKLILPDDKSATDALPPLPSKIQSLPALVPRRIANAPPTSMMDDCYTPMNNGSSFGLPNRMMQDSSPIPRTVSNNSTTDLTDTMTARFLDQIMSNRRAELEQDIERQLQVRVIEMQLAQQQEAKRHAIIRLILSIENQNISGI